MELGTPIMNRLGVATILLVALVATTQGSFAASTAPESNGWSKRGVFAFYDLVLDFEKQEEVIGPNSSRLKDCSDRSYYCAYASIISIVLPKKCMLVKVGDVWSHERLKTRVLSSYEIGAASLETFGPRRMYLLGDVSFPHVVYEYNIDQGVIGIYYNPSADLVSAAVSGNMKPYEDRYTYRELATLDKFGKCAA